MIIGAFVAILNQTLLATALPMIMDDLHITAATGQWLTTAFLLTNGIMIPITALLIEKISSKTLFITAMTVFTIGTIIASVAGSFPSCLLVVLFKRRVRDYDAITSNNLLANFPA